MHGKKSTCLSTFHALFDNIDRASEAGSGSTSVIIIMAAIYLYG